MAYLILGIMSAVLAGIAGREMLAEYRARGGAESLGDIVRGALSMDCPRVRSMAVTALLAASVGGVLPCLLGWYHYERAVARAGHWYDLQESRESAVEQWRPVAGASAFGAAIAVVMFWLRPRHVFMAFVRLAFFALLLLASTSPAYFAHEEMWLRGMTVHPPTSSIVLPSIIMLSSVAMSLVLRRRVLRR